MYLSARNLTNLKEIDWLSIEDLRSLKGAVGSKVLANVILIFLKSKKRSCFISNYCKKPLRAYRNQPTILSR